MRPSSLGDCKNSLRGRGAGRGQEARGPQKPSAGPGAAQSLGAGQEALRKPRPGAEGTSALISALSAQQGSRPRPRGQWRVRGWAQRGVRGSPGSQAIAETLGCLVRIARVHAVGRLLGGGRGRVELCLCPAAVVAGGCPVRRGLPAVHLAGSLGSGTSAGRQSCVSPASGKGRGQRCAEPPSVGRWLTPWLTPVVELLCICSLPFFFF